MSASNIFLDCGAHHGESLRAFRSRGLLDGAWEIHAFEPNPACELPRRLRDFGLPVAVHAAAVWTRDGTLRFHQEDHTVSRSGSPTDGASTVDGWGSAAAEAGFVRPGHRPPIEVRCVDLGRVLSELPPAAQVVCKMDVEGAEYAVLRDLLRRGLAKRIAELYVEFHHRGMAAESAASTQALRDLIADRGVRLRRWS